MVLEIPRSLRLSDDGKLVAESRARAFFGPHFQSALTNTIVSLRGNAGSTISRYTVSRFFRAEQNISFDYFEAICIKLELDWLDVSDVSSYAYTQDSAMNSSVQDEESALDEAVAEVRSQVQGRIVYDCDKIQPFSGGMPISTGYVEPDLLLIERLPSEEIVDEDVLKIEADEENYDRLGIRISYETRLDSHQVAIANQRLLIYGGPGSGKTSYLKWIAIQCSQGTLLKDYVPVFIRIKDFAAAGGRPSLQTYIETYLQDCGVQQADKMASLLFGAGRIVLLLDGLDEVPEANRQDVHRHVTDLINRYRDSRFIFSCRLPLLLSFYHFQKILISLFSPRQIATYAHKRFASASENGKFSDRFLERLPKHKALRELTRTPLLLELLCIVFESNENFPTTRVDLYAQGIRKLLERKVLTIPNSHLPRLITSNDIEGMLRKIAADFFIAPQPQILFATRDVERKIEDYLSQLFAVSPFQVPAPEVLEALELHSGLIAKRAYNYCSFSHLTFQEYFTADYLVRTDNYSIVHDHITQHQWRFVIELVAELLSPDQANPFFQAFKQTVDRLVSGNDKMRSFLSWVDQIAASVSASVHAQTQHKRTLLRAWYFAFTFEDAPVISHLQMLDRQFSLPDFEYATITLASEMLEAHTLFYRAYHATSSDDGYRTFMNMIEAIYERFKNKDLRLETQLISWQETIRLRQINYHNPLSWWCAERSTWRNRICQFMTRQHNLQCDWKLTTDEIETLRQYYDATKLLSICMNRSRMSLEQRRVLVDSMLLLDAEPDPPRDHFVGF